LQRTFPWPLWRRSTNNCMTKYSSQVKKQEGIVDVRHSGVLGFFQIP